MENDVPGSVAEGMAKLFRKLFKSEQLTCETSSSS